MLCESAPSIDAALLLEQHFRYSYDRPIRKLRHRLVVIPRAVHGAQVRGDFGVSVSEGDAKVTVELDGFANCVAHVEVDAVSSEIEFSVWATVVRRVACPNAEPASLIDDPRLVASTPLTAANAEIAEMGRRFAAGGEPPVAIAEMACHWSSRAISYGFGATDVHTSAAAALAEAPVSARTMRTSCWRCAGRLGSLPDMSLATSPERAPPTPGSRSWNTHPRAR
ncbi:MAG: transglutaminase domain protein [Acidimicrobiaceae bacterium]|nr:transglutaminase domain protein [Acidimicrobiaceae bacterium]